MGFGGGTLVGLVQGLVGIRYRRIGGDCGFVRPTPAFGVEATFQGVNPSFSWAYIIRAMPRCFKLLVQDIARAFSRALLKAGNSMAAKMAIIAMTTNNSINVNLKHILYHKSDPCLVLKMG